MNFGDIFGDDLGKKKLLTEESVKIIKSNKTHRSWLTAVMYLAPGTAADQWLVARGERPFVGNLCPHKTRGCFGERGENCIFGTGQLALPVAQNAMIQRTLFYKSNTNQFLERLYREINNQRKKATKLGRKLAMRLNGTSDIRWEKLHPHIFSDFADVTFYDYTKVYERLMPKFPGAAAPQLPANYRLTFSRSEENNAQCEWVIKNRPDVNVAMVFDTRPKIGTSKAEPLPKMAFGRPVYDGDRHDLRFLDPRGVIVGLRAKGFLRREVKEKKSLFVIYTDRDKKAPRVLEGLGELAPRGYVRVGVVTAQDIPGAIKGATDSAKGKA